jgi:hypothetical protein
MISDHALMQLHTAALYRLDSRDRLLAVNEPGDPHPPRLFFGRTRTGHLWRFRHDLTEALVDELETLLRAEPVGDDLSQPPRCLAALQAALAGDVPLSGTWNGPAWQFPDELPTFAEGIVSITPERADLVQTVFPGLADDLPWRQPCLAIVEDGQLASLCYSSRNTLAAAEAGVDTIEAFRGRGYAAAVAAAWAHVVRHEGRIPLYSTSWDNLPSCAVARKLSLVLYGADLTIE